MSTYLRQKFRFSSIWSSSSSSSEEEKETETEREELAPLEHQVQEEEKAQQDTSKLDEIERTKIKVMRDLVQRQDPSSKGASLSYKLSECITSRGGNVFNSDIFVPEHKNV